MQTNNKSQGSRKVVVVGAGAVGATYSYALAQSGLVDDTYRGDKHG